MARRVKWTPAALNDLDEIAEFIARDSRYYAAAFVRQAKTSSQSLSKMTFRTRMVPEIQEENLREILLDPYRLIFRILASEIQIIAIIHQSRDLSSRLKQINDN